MSFKIRQWSLRWPPRSPRVGNTSSKISHCSCDNSSHRVRGTSQNRGPTACQATILGIGNLRTRQTESEQPARELTKYPYRRVYPTAMGYDYHQITETCKRITSSKPGILPVPYAALRIRTLIECRAGNVHLRGRASRSAVLLASTVADAITTRNLIHAVPCLLVAVEGTSRTPIV